MEKMLELQGICKSYLLGAVDIEILKGIDISINRGEFVSIIGSSGCGKSTLMNIVGLLDTPTKGQYIFEGQETSKFAEKELSSIRNQKIGFVFQQFHLLSRLSAIDNICLPLVYRNMKESLMKKTASEMLERVGMSGKERNRPHELSGGQQQRIAIARALAGKPALILADEPTGALDTRTSQDIMELFMELNNEGITILIITHDTKIAKQSKRVVRMHDGLLKEA